MTKTNQGSLKCSFIDLLRQPKIFDMSIFDWLVFLLGMLIISRWTKQTLPQVSLIGFSIGIIVHYLIGTPTVVGYYLGLNTYPPRKQC